jgi:hypothetical protein
METDDEKLYRKNTQIAVTMCHRITGYLRHEGHMQLIAVMLTRTISNHIEREFTEKQLPIPEIVIEKVNQLNRTAQSKGFGPLIDLD